MVHHFFKGKDELFALSVELPADPEEVLAGVTAVAPERRAELIVRAVLRLWESPAHPSLVAFLLGTLGSKARTALLRELVTRTVIGRIMAGDPGPAEEVALRGRSGGHAGGGAYDGPLRGPAGTPRLGGIGGGCPACRPKSAALPDGRSCLGTAT